VPGGKAGVNGSRASVVDSRRATRQQALVVDLRGSEDQLVPSAGQIGPARPDDAADAKLSAWSQFSRSALSPTFPHRSRNCGQGAIAPTGRTPGAQSGGAGKSAGLYATSASPSPRASPAVWASQLDLGAAVVFGPADVLQQFEVFAELQAEPLGGGEILIVLQCAPRSLMEPR
jgi:hypothetical protein